MYAHPTAAKQMADSKRQAYQEESSTACRAVAVGAGRGWR